MTDRNPYEPPIASVLEQSDRLGVHPFGAIRLAAVLGGPIAAGYLVCVSLHSIQQPKRMKIGVALFTLSALGWLYAIFNVPPDFISQLIPFILQVPLWWIGAQYLLAAPMREYRQRGGTFRSWWSAIRFGLLTFALTKITLFIIFDWLHLA